MMKKAIIIAVCIFILINSIGTVNTSAAADILVFTIENVIDMVSRIFDNNNSVNSFDAPVTNDVLYIGTDANGGYIFKPREGLQGNDADYATYISDYINTNYYTDELCKNLINDFRTDANTVDTRNYETIKNLATNSYLSYIQDKTSAEAAGKTLFEFMADDGFAKQFDERPSFDFNFVGPLTPYQIQDKQQKLDAITMSDFVFLRPHTQFYYSSVAEVKSDGWDGVYSDTPSDKGYVPKYVDRYAYSLGWYVIYEGEFYFSYGRQTPNSDWYHSLYCYSTDFPSLATFSSLDNVGLSGVVGGSLSGKQYQYGVFLNTAPGKSIFDISDEKEDIISMKFDDMIPGEDIVIKRTNDEDTVGNAINLKIVDDDPVLNIDHYGNIINVNGIDMETLEKLLTELKGDVDLSGIEGYLNTIIDILNRIDAKEGEIETICSNILKLQTTEFGTIKGYLIAIRDKQTETNDTLTDIKDILGELRDNLPEDVDLSEVEELLQALYDKDVDFSEVIGSLDLIYEKLDELKYDDENIISSINALKTIASSQYEELRSQNESLSRLETLVRQININMDDMYIDLHKLNDIDEKLKIIIGLFSYDELESFKPPSGDNLENPLTLGDFVVKPVTPADAVTVIKKIIVFEQVKGLLNNLLDERNYSDDAPSFTYNYDSDHDGVSESYTYLDLSFLEKPISSSGSGAEEAAEDVRFSGMTLRSFIRSLILLLCYSGFAIRTIKKIPGLFGD